MNITTLEYFPTQMIAGVYLGIVSGSPNYLLEGKILPIYLDKMIR